METMFSWTIPNEHNKISSVSKFTKLNLFVIIEEIKVIIIMSIFITEEFSITNDIIFKIIPFIKLDSSINKWRDYYLRSYEI